MPTWYPVAGSPIYYAPTNSIYFADNDIAGGSDHSFVYAVEDKGNSYNIRSYYDIDSQCWG
jgi:hypothetical protein